MRALNGLKWPVESEALSYQERRRGAYKRIQAQKRDSSWHWECDSKAGPVDTRRTKISQNQPKSAKNGVPGVA